MSLASRSTEYCFIQAYRKSSVKWILDKFIVKRRRVESVDDGESYSSSVLATTTVNEPSTSANLNLASANIQHTEKKRI